jgi:hypothetical protein
MSDIANSFGNMKPDMKDTYTGKNKRFQKIQSRLKKQHQEHDKSVIAIINLNVSVRENNHGR